MTTSVSASDVSSTRPRKYDGKLANKEVIPASTRGSRRSRASCACSSARTTTWLRAAAAATARASASSIAAVAASFAKGARCGAPETGGREAGGRERRGGVTAAPPGAAATTGGLGEAPAAGDGATSALAGDAGFVAPAPPGAGGRLTRRDCRCAINRRQFRSRRRAGASDLDAGLPRRARADADALLTHLPRRTGRGSTGDQEVHARLGLRDEPVVARASPCRERLQAAAVLARERDGDERGQAEQNGDRDLWRHTAMIGDSPGRGGEPGAASRPASRLDERGQIEQRALVIAQVQQDFRPAPRAPVADHAVRLVLGDLVERRSAPDHQRRHRARTGLPPGAARRHLRGEGRIGSCAYSVHSPAEALGPPAVAQWPCTTSLNDARATASICASSIECVGLMTFASLVGNGVAVGVGVGRGAALGTAPGVAVGFPRDVPAAFASLPPFNVASPSLALPHAPTSQTIAIAPTNDGMPPGRVGGCFCFHDIPFPPR